MSEKERGERTLLQARIEDALTRCEKGIPSCISFLTPGECKRAERILRTTGAWESVWFWGGYEGAERKSLFFLPEYLLLCLSATLQSAPAQEILALLDELATEEVFAVRVKRSGFRTLNHRDYLGALMGLGLERDALGDIALQKNGDAVVFCTKTVGNFLIESLTKVASDTVRCSPYEVDEAFTDGRTYQPIRDIVASPRLDSVVAALTNLSREQAQNAVRSGLVEVDYEPVERTDLFLTPPAVISVRGHGRFVLRGFDGETRKGRLRLLADKLV